MHVMSYVDDGDAVLVRSFFTLDTALYVVDHTSISTLLATTAVVYRWLRLY